MTDAAPLAIFGEALLDCFPDGRDVIGGAPLNVAWHLQAFGDAPLFISRVGTDAPGNQISTAMQAWGMGTTGLQLDPLHATGSVEVSITNGEPHYDICADRAYDHIDASALPVLSEAAFLYHGTLALREPTSLAALRKLRATPGIAVFIDLNLREPWWTAETVFELLQGARWVKLNQHELAALGFASTDLGEEMASMQQRFGLEQLILTCGEAGARLRTSAGQYFEQPAVAPDEIVDSVGAGDAFSAMYIHGLRAGWPPERTLSCAQQFASAMLGQRGATVQDPAFYRRFQ